ncbi:MAG: GNAT family N-acetyltransferase [Chloroflexi bacterium]|nr:GNAT family N-acetyltransferase [Chloroflexota bacterium]
MNPSTPLRTSPVIRPMVAEDKPAVIRILHNTPEFHPDEVVIAEELIDSYLRDPQSSGYYVLVSETDTAVSGYVCYGPTPLTQDTWDIYWIAVDRRLQRQGIGRALMTAAESEIERGQGRLIIIQTSSTPDYEKTRRFYVSSGYREAARVPDYYAPGDDLVIFVKGL